LLKAIVQQRRSSIKGEILYLTSRCV